jgi:predicted ATP-grasp superfamily ATP-dependent carboligase
VPVVTLWHSESEHARHSRYIEQSVHAPDPGRKPERYLDRLEEVVRQAGRGLVLPTTDETVTLVAKAKGALERHAAVACPPWHVAELFLDKHRTYELAGRLGVAAPHTTLPRDARHLQALASTLSYPCLLKPRSSYLYTRAFGVKMKKAETPAELLSAWREAEEAGIGTLIQEFIPGPETAGLNYNGYYVDGEPLVETTARKLRLWPSDIGYPTVVVSHPAPEVVEPSRRLLRGMGIEGFANVEFKQDGRTGEPILMEVNGRPNMSGGLSTRCGVDFPLITYRHLVAGERPHPGSVPPEAVYWINEASDLAGSVTRMRAGGMSARDCARPYLHRHVFAWLSPSDPAPFLKAGFASLARRRRTPSR